MPTAIDIEALAAFVLGNNPTALVRYLSQSDRDKIDAADFAGPDRSFPIDTQAHLDAAAHLIGHAANPAAVKAKAKRIAKRKGFKLPASWQDDGDGDGDGNSAHDQDNHRQGQQRDTEPVVIRADGNHDPFTGNHSHAHPAFGDGADSGHAHDHPHHNEADHNPSSNPNHSHAAADIQAGGPERAAMPEIAHLYAPITRIDPDKWEVEGVATSEEVDSFGTVFSFEASKKAFREWANRTANVREMHDKKAVGKGLNWWPDEEHKRIHVQLRVSRGAPDTWAKIEDGVLSGLSVGAIKPKWSTIDRNGKVLPYLADYELAELSLVDNASNPDAQGLVIARAASGLTDLIDITEPEPTITALTQDQLDRAGARLSSDSRAALHEMRNKAISLCQCDECQRMQNGDGDNDADDGAVGDVTAKKMQDRIALAVERALSGVIQRQHSILARFASIPEQPISTASIDTQLSAFREEVTATIERVMQASNPGDVHSLLNDINAKVERIAAQPAVGVAPILNGSRPVDKTLATDYRSPQSSIPNMQAVTRDLQALQAAGGLNTLDLQQDAARLILQMQQGR